MKSSLCKMNKLAKVSALELAVLSCSVKNAISPKYSPRFVIRSVDSNHGVLFTWRFFK